MLCLVLFIACTGSSSTGPSSPDTHGWIVGLSTTSGVTILHTTDGSTWTEQSTQVTIPGAELFSVSCVDSLTAWAAGGISDGFGVVLRTTDGGTTWKRLGIESEIPSGTICVSALSSDVAWVSASDNSIYHTTDAGITWQDMSDPSFDGNNFDGIFALSNSDIWLCGGDGQNGLIIHTNDGGSSWTPHADSVLGNYNMLTIAAWDASNIWAVGNGFTIIKTTDGGANWEIVTPDSLQGSPNDANGLTLLSADDAWVVLDYGNIWRTTDGGDNWTIQTVPTEVDGYFFFRICALDVNTAWATGASPAGSPEGVIIHTSNGGNTWTRQDDGSFTELWGVSFEGDYPN